MIDLPCCHAGFYMLCSAERRLKMAQETIQYYGVFMPKKDIAAYELAQLIPFLVPGGRGLTQTSIAEIGSAARHFVLFTNETDFHRFLQVSETNDAEKVA